MDFEKLCNTYAELIQYMQDDGYSDNYVRRLKTEINWLIKNKEVEDILSYEDACRIRESRTNSPEMRRWYRLAYGILMRFDIFNDFPDRRMKIPLIKRGAYPQLNTAFKEVIDLYQADGRTRGLRENTIYGNSSAGSCFLLAMQNIGHLTLKDITENDVMSFFSGENGFANLSSGYKKEIAAVLRADLGTYTEAARCILVYLPMIRPKRKNIPYLIIPDEVAAIHSMLNDENSGLSLRNRAIGALLFFTAIRGCDIAKMEFSDIDWEKEEIRLTQQKTDGGLVLPLTATIGNAIYDYITLERPQSTDSHIFLREIRPYEPFKPRAMWYISSKIYKAASVRQNAGDRRGTHLFRYHLATSFAENGVARPVISDTLGHTDPSSLDCYLFADMVHLRQCALSIADFPVSGEVFSL